MSRAMATSILRKFSAWRSSRLAKASLPIFVTPSTSSAMSSPNRSTSTALLVAVSSSTSWRSPAATVVTSILNSTSSPATARGWMW